MVSSPKITNFYAHAGIDDLARFYRERFFTNGVLDARYFDPVNRFDIRFARTMWVYDNVRPHSSVLDLGCGEGLLALLKNKNVYLAGVDLSNDLLKVAERNAYDTVVEASLAALPFRDASFDYVVSLDVMGHIAFEDKDTVLAETRRVLKKDGVTMHGVEVMNRELHKDYHEMTPEELRAFVSIDGHIGLEDEVETETRFGRFFEHVLAEPRYTLNLSADEIVKQASAYGVPFDKDFVEYLRGLSYKERRAFDMAMGYVFQRISDLHIKLPPSGLYMLLKASRAPLGPFYNQHRDRVSLFGMADAATPDGRVCLDRHQSAHFDEGWYGANYLPPVARWMGERARVLFRASTLSKIRLDLTTHMPDMWRRALGLELSLNGQRLAVFSLFRYGWLEVSVDVPEELVEASNGFFELEIRAARTWQPKAANPESTDDRELSVAVCNIEIYL